MRHILAAIAIIAPSCFPGDVEKPPSPPSDMKTEQPAQSRLVTIDACVKALDDADLRPVKQVPATVIDKGVLRNVPYLSFRTGYYELNVYGDPTSPACVEVGMYKPLLDSDDAKQKCLKVIKTILQTQADKDFAGKLDLKKDLKVSSGLTFEVTPATAPDAYGGWWISIYDEKLLDSMRATAEDMKSITVTSAAAKANPDADKNWTPTEIASARGQTEEHHSRFTRRDIRQTSREFEITAGAAIVDGKKNGPIGENSSAACEGSAPVTIRFPDDSKMELAPSGSTVLHRRSVELKAGKASFEIQKTQSAADAFIVKTAVGSVTVVGTKFSVELQPKGKSTQGGTEMRSAIVMAVTVLAGSVSVEYNGSHYVLAMGQSQAFGADAEKTDAPALPVALKGFSGTMNGEVVKVEKDSIVLKLHPGNAEFKKLGVGGKEVPINIKDVKDAPELQANDGVYMTVSEVDGQLVAKTIMKMKTNK